MPHRSDNATFSNLFRELIGASLGVEPVRPQRDQFSVTATSVFMVALKGLPEIGWVFKIKLIGEWEHCPIFTTSTRSPIAWLGQHNTYLVDSERNLATRKRVAAPGRVWLPADWLIDP